MLALSFSVFDPQLMFARYLLKIPELSACAPCAAGRCLYLRQNPANEFVQKAYRQVFRWRSLVGLATRHKTSEMPTLPSKANSSLYIAGRPSGQSCLAREEKFSGLSTAPAYLKHKAS
jgi:hypothetical protein